MKNQNDTNPSELFLLKTFSAAKDIVSRRNQDGTVILMKLDNSNVFYKLDGMLGLLWATMQTPVHLENLQNAWASVTQTEEKSKTQMMESFVLGLAARDLIQTAEVEVAPEKQAEVSAVVQKGLEQAVVTGSIKDFNIDQIEKEVLNDSIYLDVFAGSDLALKKDFSAIESALDKVSSLEGVHFHWASSNQSAARQTGVIAQQVLDLMPELVRRDQDSGNLAVNYLKMIPYLIESIKELNTKIEAQADEILELKTKLNQ